MWLDFKVSLAGSCKTQHYAKGSIYTSFSDCNFVALGGHYWALTVVQAEWPPLTSCPLVQIIWCPDELPRTRGLRLLWCCLFLWTSVCFFPSWHPEHQSVLTLPDVAISTSFPSRSVTLFIRTQPVKLDTDLNTALGSPKLTAHTNLFGTSPSHLQLTQAHCDVWTTRWSHLLPWPRSGTSPLPHPAPPHHHLLHPLLLLYRSWPPICNFQQCAGHWRKERMERERQRRGPTAVRPQMTPSARWWVSLGWDTGSSSPGFWRWERGDWEMEKMDKRSRTCRGSQV